MRKSLQVSLLVLVMTASAYAGDMQCGVMDTPPPPPPASITLEEPAAADGEMQNGVTDSLTDTVLNVIGSVLALL